MTEWGAPWAFLLLVPVLLLVARRRMVRVQRLRVARLLRAGMTLRRALWWAPSALRVAGLALVVVALARPRVARREVVVETEGVDILLAIDTSGSMRAQDFATGVRAASRLEVAKGVVADFIERRPHDRIGLVVFGEDAFTQVPLTRDHQTLRDVLSTVQIGVAGQRGTAVGTAIAVAARRLEQIDNPERVIILLTDGQSNSGRLGPVEAAQLAAALDIKVYTVGVGVSAGGPDALDAPTLARVAEVTGASFLRATDAAGLARVYETIDAMEPSPAEVTELVDHLELYRPWLVAGLALLMLQAVLRATWLRRSP